MHPHQSGYGIIAIRAVRHVENAGYFQPVKALKPYDLGRNQMRFVHGRVKRAGQAGGLAAGQVCRIDVGRRG